MKLFTKLQAETRKQLTSYQEKEDIQHGIAIQSYVEMCVKQLECLPKDRNGKPDAGFLQPLFIRSYTIYHQPTAKYHNNVGEKIDKMIKELYESRNKNMKTAEQFVKENFKGIEDTTYFPAIVAIAEGYAKHVQSNKPCVANEATVCRHSTDCSLGYNCKKNKKDCEENEQTHKQTDYNHN